MKSVFEIGKIYNLILKCGDIYNDVSVINMDEKFITFFYKTGGIFKKKILNLDSIWGALENKDLKRVWYLDEDKIYSERLSKEEITVNKKAGIIFFYDEDSAKEYISNIKQKKLQDN